MDERDGRDFGEVPWAPVWVGALIIAVLVLSVPVGLASGLGFLAMSRYGILEDPAVNSAVAGGVGLILHLTLALWLLRRGLKRRGCGLSALWGESYRGRPLLVAAVLLGGAAMSLQWWVLGGNSATAIPGWGGILLHLPGTGILGPIVEELLFRGLLYASLRRRFGAGTATWVSTAAFLVYHPGLFWLPWRLAFVALAGVICAVLLERTRSLTPPVLFHCTWNGLAVLLSA